MVFDLVQELPIVHCAGEAALIHLQRIHGSGGIVFDQWYATLGQELSDVLEISLLLLVGNHFAILECCAVTG